MSSNFPTRAASHAWSHPHNQEHYLLFIEAVASHNHIIINLISTTPYYLIDPLRFTYIHSCRILKRCKHNLQLLKAVDALLPPCYYPTWPLILYPPRRSATSNTLKQLIIQTYYSCPCPRIIVLVVYKFFVNTPAATTYI